MQPHDRRHLVLRIPLKDPRTSPAAPFYIGKGTGTRSRGHDMHPDATTKGQRIREIQVAGQQVIIARLVEQLPAAQALRIEAELIAAFGTVATGGLLMNMVMPAGLGGNSRPQVVVPSGLKEKAQVGLTLMKDAVLEPLQANPAGISTSETASVPGLHSDCGGGSKEFLSYSRLGLLMREGKVARTAGGKKHVAQVR